MLIVLAVYAGLIWLIFFQLKLLPWGRATQVIAAVVGLLIILVVIGLLNTKTPSGRVTIVAWVNQIAPVVGGVLANVPAEANKPVEAGSALLKLDKRPFQYAVDEAEATLRIAKLTLERKQEVFDSGSGSISEQSLDESRAAFDHAKARLDKARYDLEQTIVRAPAAGVVTSLGVSVGDQARPLEPVIPFIRTDSIFLAGVFSQNGLDAMLPGTPVKVVLNRLPGRIFTTKVVKTVLELRPVNSQSAQNSLALPMLAVKVMRWSCWRGLKVLTETSRSQGPLGRRPHSGRTPALWAYWRQFYCMSKCLEHTSDWATNVAVGPSRTCLSAPAYVRFHVQSGHSLLQLLGSAFDPIRT